LLADTFWICDCTHSRDCMNANGTHTLHIPGGLA
jgi:hypothetical protein